MSESRIYYGVDINDNFTMFSYFHKDMKEPDTVSTVVGSEMYQIPTYMALVKGTDQWVYGDEAKRLVKLHRAYAANHFFHKATTGDRIMVEGREYQADQLLAMFLSKLFALAGHTGGRDESCKVVFTVDRVNPKILTALKHVVTLIDFKEEQCSVIDHMESFYYYTLNQDPQIFLGDVMLFDYTGRQLRSCLLERNQHTVPQTVSLEEASYGTLIEEKDDQFNEILERVLTGRNVTGIYLIGEGFEGEWMKVSLATLCKGRRVFMGKNLYSKGACYCGGVKDGFKQWPFVYMGDNELKLNVSIQVKDHGRQQYLTLLTAGESWYDSHGECEVILDGRSEITVYLQKPEAKQAQITVLELNGLPKRENRSTRLRITAKPKDDVTVDISIRDLGFGEIAPASDQVWNHRVSMPKKEEV